MAMHSITKFLEAANQNAAEVNRKVVEITQRNLNLGFELAKSLARGAGNPTEIVRVQTSFWRKQFDELATQAEEARNRLFGFNVARPKKLEFRPSLPSRSPPRRRPLARKARGTIAQREIPLPRGSGKRLARRHLRHRDFLSAQPDQVLVHQLESSPRFKKRTHRRRCKNPQEQILLMKERSPKLQRLW